MILTEKDYNMYLDIHHKLMYFTGKKSSLIPENYSLTDFKNQGTQYKLNLRNLMVNDLNYIYLFIKKYGNKLSKDEANLLKGFRKLIKSSFIIFKELKHYAYFFHIETQTFFQVSPLSDRFETLVKFMPVKVTAVILPFKNIIIYDGFLYSDNIKLDDKSNKILNNMYKTKKRKNQIITRIDNKTSIRYKTYFD